MRSILSRAQVVEYLVHSCCCCFPGSRRCSLVGGRASHPWRWALNINSLTPLPVCFLCFLLVMERVISFSASVSSHLLRYDSQYYGLYPVRITSSNKLLLVCVALLVIVYHSSRHVPNTEHITVNKAGLSLFVEEVFYWLL